jgi:hypothetical protein
MGRVGCGGHSMLGWHKLQCYALSTEHKGHVKGHPQSGSMGIGAGGLAH